MDARRSGSQEFSDWHRGSWEADANALTAFGSSAYAAASMHCDLSEDDVLPFGLLDDSGLDAGARQDDEVPMLSKLEDPQQCQNHSDQTQITVTDSKGSFCQSVAARRDSGCLLEEALTSTGMRQLLPQISTSRSSIDIPYSQVQRSPLARSSSYMPYCSGAASVFVPCNDPQPLQFKTEPAWGLDIELRSSGSMASSGTDGCVPDVNQCSLPYLAVKSEACVPDYHNGCDDSSCMPPIQSPILGIDGRMQPRVAFLKLAEDSFSSDSEDPRMLKMQPVDGMPLISSDSTPTSHRKECLQRYRDKKQRRHFSHKVRYTARKLNADRRPRYKGRFIKASDMSALDAN